MSISLIIAITIIQFIVQYLLYKPARDWLYERHSKHLRTLSFLPTELFVINLICTIIVCILTSAGLITGITNLFASAILGLVMNIQYESYKRALFNGSYYEKLAEKKRKKELEREILERMARQRREKENQF